MLCPYCPPGRLRRGPCAFWNPVLRREAPFNQLALWVQVCSGSFLNPPSHSHSYFQSKQSKIFSVDDLSVFKISACSLFFGPWDWFSRLTPNFIHFSRHHLCVTIALQSPSSLLLHRHDVQPAPGLQRQHCIALCECLFQTLLKCAAVMSFLHAVLGARHRLVALILRGDKDTPSIIHHNCRCSGGGVWGGRRWRWCQPNGSFSPMRRKEGWRHSSVFFNGEVQQHHSSSLTSICFLSWWRHLVAETCDRSCERRPMLFVFVCGLKFNCVHLLDEVFWSFT